MPRQDGIDDLRRLVGEDARHQRRVWVMQRCGWAVMGGMVLLALAGGLGDGPLAASEAVSPDGALRVRHDAVARQDSATRWHIALPPGGEEMTITSDALARMEVVNIQPAPLRQTRGARTLRLHFAPAPAPGLVTVTVEPLTPGMAAVSVAAGEAEASFRTLVLP